MSPALVGRARNSSVVAADLDGFSNLALSYSGQLPTDSNSAIQIKLLGMAIAMANFGAKLGLILSLRIEAT